MRLRPAMVIGLIGTLLTVFAEDTREGDTMHEV